MIPLPSVEEATNLIEFVEAGKTHRLHPDALKAWRFMCDEARASGICLRLVSAFRSVARQQEIIDRKLAKGFSAAEIYAVNARPGYSEHHSGRAVDITTDDVEPLEVSFEATDAFAWLQQYAGGHHFRLSYPRGNAYGITYEPWHWCYSEADASE